MPVVCLGRGEYDPALAGVGCTSWQQFSRSRGELEGIDGPSFVLGRLCCPWPEWFSPRGRSDDIPSDRQTHPPAWQPKVPRTRGREQGAGEGRGAGTGRAAEGGERRRRRGGATA